MPRIYSIQAPDGYTYDIEGPDDADERSLFSMARRASQERQLAELNKPEPETTIGGHAKEFFKGIPAGAIGLAQTAGTGISALLPERLEKGTRETLKKVGEDFGSPFTPEAGYEDAVSRKLGEGLGSTLPFFALGPLGTAGRAASVGLAASAGAGEARERAEAEGATGGERALATFLGIGPGLLDVVAPELRWGKSIITRAATSGGLEGATEAAQQVAQNLISKGVYNPEQSAFADVLESGGYGAGTGALASMLVDLALGKRGGRGGPKKPEDKAGTPLLPAPTGPEPGSIEDIYGVKPSAESAKVEMPRKEPTVERAPAATVEEAFGFPREVSLNKDVRDTTSRREPVQVEGKPVTPELPAPYIEGEVVPERAGLPETRALRGPEEEVRALPQTRALPAPTESKTDQEIAALQAAGVETPGVAPVGTTAPTVEPSKPAGVVKPKLAPTTKPKLKAVEPMAPQQYVPGIGMITPAAKPVEAAKTEAPKTEDKAHPRVDSIERFPMGPTTIKPKVVAEGKPLYHNTNVEGVNDILRNEGQFEYQPLFVADNQDIALGQGANTGVDVVFRPNAISGEENVKPGTGELAGREYKADVIAPNAVESVTFNNAQQLKQLRGVSANALKTNFTREDMPNGKIKFTRNGLKETPSAVTGTKPAGVGVSAKGVGQGAGKGTGGNGAATRAKPSKPTGLADDKRAAGRVEGRKTKPQPTVAEEIATAAEEIAKKEKAVKAEPKVAAKPKKEKPSRKPQTKQKMPTAGAEKPLDFAKVMREGYVVMAPTDVGVAADRDAVANLVNSTGGDTTRQAARKYFSKMNRLVDNLLNISFDFVFPSERSRLTSEKMDERAFFSGMNTNNAIKAVQWVQKHLTPGVNKKLTDYINMWAEEYAHVSDEAFMSRLMAANTEKYVYLRTDAKITDLTEEDEKFFEEYARTVGKNIKALDAVSRNTMALHPMVQAMLRAGDLRSAMRYFAGTLDGIAAKIATKLADTITDTKVEVVEGLKDESGREVPGLFDPSTNTIYLDSKTGMNGHALTHEVVHALTSHILDNPNHPVTKQLQKIYDEVKGQLSGYYGSQSLDEFVAEAMSNPDFQQELQQITPDGKPVSAWTRFVNAIKNFVRKMVGLEPTSATAYGEIDQLITSILSPAPESRDAQSLYMMSAAGKAGEWFTAMGDKFDSLPIWNDNLAVRVRVMLTERIPKATKEFFLKLLPMHALTDVAKGKIPTAKVINDLIREKFGFETKMQNELRTTLHELEKWASQQTQEKLDDLFYAANESTLAKVDVTLSRQEFINKMTKAGKDKTEIAEALKEYDRIRPYYDRIGADGQRAYKIVRDSYKRLYDEIYDTIIQRLQDTGADEASAKKITNEIYAKLMETAGAIDPYFALGRPEGDYRLAFNMTSEETGTFERYVQHFASDFERKQFIKELEQHLRDTGQSIEKAEITPFHAMDDYDYRNAPPTSFVRSVLKVLQTNSVDETATQEVLRVFVDLLPETSFVKGFKKRKGVRGFEKNIIKTLHDKGNALIRQLANMKYGAKLSAARDQIDADIKGQTDEATAMLAKALKEHTKFAINPRLPYWSKVMRSFGFAMTLGFNVSSAIINTSQLALIVYPHLIARHGVKAANRAMVDAIKLYSNSGFSHDSKGFVAGMSGNTHREMPAFISIDNYFSKFKRDANGEISDADLKTLPKEIQRLYPLWRMADHFGELSRSQVQEVLDSDDYDSYISKMNRWSGMMMHITERMNRQITMMAAYELELQKLEKEGKLTREAMDKAAEAALYTTEMTNGGISAAAAPRIAQSGWGAVAFMYKRFGVTMYYLLGKTMHTALKGADAKTRKEAWAQMGMTYGTAAMFSGIRGLPLFGALAMVYNMFKDDDDDDLETVVRKAVPYWASRGLINPITGLETGSRTGLSDLIFRDPMGSQDTPFIAQVAEALGGPLVGVANRWERGLSQINDGHVLRGMEQMVPSVMGNAMKSMRYATEGTQTLRGDPITGEVNAWNVFGQAFGFAPAEYTRQLEENAAKKGYERATLEKRSKLLDKYWMAYKNGDSSGLEDVTSDMAKFNEKHPSVAISGLTIQHSLSQHVRSKAMTQHGITYNKKFLGEMNDRFSSYDIDVERE